MITRNLFVFVLICILTLNLYAQDVEIRKQGEITENIFNPDQVYPLEDDELLIVDNTVNFPVYVLDTTSNKITGQIRQGKGPGELSLMYKKIYKLSDAFFVWDHGNQRTNVYDDKLNYLYSLSFSEFGFLYEVIPVSETEFYLINQKEELIGFIELEDARTSKAKSITAITVPDVFDQFENVSLRQAFKIHVHRDEACLTNEFTSLLFCIRGKKIQAITTKPDDIINNSYLEGSYGTELTRFPLVSLDIEQIKDLTVVLYKGKKADLDIIRNDYNNDVDTYMSDFTHANTLFVYDSGLSFLKKVNLPDHLSSISYDGENGLYGISSYGGNARVIKYQVTVN